MKCKQEKCNKLVWTNGLCKNHLKKESAKEHEAQKQVIEKEKKPLK